MKILSYVKSEDIHHMIANAGRKNSVYIDFSNDPSALLGKTENYALVFAEVSLTDEKIMLASKRLLEDCPALHIVFLMRECSFEHSMRAMRIGVKNILYGSDVNEMTLGRVIEDYKNNADETLYRRENINRLFEKLIFFQDARLNEQNAVRLNSLFSLRGGGKSYFVAAVISSEFMIRQTHVSSLQKKISCEKICRLFSDFSGSDFDVCFVFYLDDVFYIVLALPHQPSSGRMAANVREVLTDLRRYAESELSGSAVYLASRSRLDFRRIDKSLEELNILLNAYHVFGESQIVLYSDYYAKDFNGSAYERLTESAVKMFDEIGKNGNYREHEEKIFSEAFVAARARGLKTTAEEYARTVISPLGGVPGEPALTLWFGSDMFCQINFITFLAWLEQSGYAGKVYFCRLEEDKDDVAEAFLPVCLRGCGEIYRDVLLLKKTPRLPLFPVTERGVKLYLGYRKKDSPIRRAIRAHLGEKDLLSRLLSSFPEYGLGDTRYLELIEEETSRR